jgi:hypothetical protein
LRARPTALGVSVGEQQSHYCDTEQNKTDRAHPVLPVHLIPSANSWRTPPSRLARGIVEQCQLYLFAEFRTYSSTSAPLLYGVKTLSIEIDMRMLAIKSARSSSLYDVAASFRATPLQFARICTQNRKLRQVVAPQLWGEVPCSSIGT